MFVSLWPQTSLQCGLENLTKALWISLIEQAMGHLGQVGKAPPAGNRKGGGLLVLSNLEINQILCCYLTIFYNSVLIVEYFLNSVVICT